MLDDRAPDEVIGYDDRGLPVSWSAKVGVAAAIGSP